MTDFKLVLNKYAVNTRIVLGLPVDGVQCNKVINLGIRKKAWSFFVSWAVFNFLRKYILCLVRYKSANCMKVPQKEPGYAVVLEIHLMGC
jgi:hypothetical protein